MNIGIRRVGLVIMALFLGLVAQLTYLQVAESSKLIADPHNTRKFLADVRQPRGEIVTSDGFVVAKSKPVNDDYRFQREYPAAHREAVRADRRLPVDPVRIGRRGEQVLLASSRARTSDSSAQEHPRSCSRGRRSPARSCSRCRRRRSSPRPRRSTGGAVRSWCSTCAPAVSSRCIRTRRSIPTCSPRTTRRTRRSRARSCSPRRTNRCSHARGARSTRPARRSRPSPPRPRSKTASTRRRSSRS